MGVRRGGAEVGLEAAGATSVRALAGVEDADGVRARARARGVRTGGRTRASTRRGFGRCAAGTQEGVGRGAAQTGGVKTRSRSSACARHHVRRPRGPVPSPEGRDIWCSTRCHRRPVVGARGRSREALAVSAVGAQDPRFGSRTGTTDEAGTEGNDRCKRRA